MEECIAWRTRGINEIYLHLSREPEASADCADGHRFFGGQGIFSGYGVNIMFIPKYFTYQVAESGCFPRL
jgi:hypothetical protein